MATEAKAIRRDDKPGDADAVQIAGAGGEIQKAYFEAVDAFDDCVRREAALTKASTAIQEEKRKKADTLDQALDIYNQWIRQRPR